MPLTETAIRAAKPKEKAYKLTDERGLVLLVDPSGGLWWRLRYRHEKREKQLSLGTYPDVGLKRAREKRDEARKLIADGIDPSVRRQAERVARGDTFEAIAREHLETKRKAFAKVTFDKRLQRLETFLFPKLGGRSIKSVLAPDLLVALKAIEARGRVETAHRVRADAGQVFRYAIATGRADRDVSADLRGALAPIVVTNHAAIIEPVQIGALLRAIDGYVGQPSTAFALKLAPLFFVRPGELRQARWEEFDIEGALWRIPGERMKMREPHIVPLARQSLELLAELEAITGPSGYLFPSLRTGARPISENTVNAALRRLGYTREQMTGHGFRTMASTTLNELGWHPDVIELQLAHAERNEVRAAYNRAQRLEDRKRMMQAWADHLDSLKAKGSVVPIKRVA